jgi:hypothetical protein
MQAMMWQGHVTYIGMPNKDPKHRRGRDAEGPMGGTVCIGGGPVTVPNTTRNSTH